MKKLVLSALIIGSIFAAAPAFAQSAAGSVDVSGTVAARCSAVTAITGSITLGELAKSDGTVDASFAGNTGGLSRSEEHTSELQSLMRISYAVFCLKKKTHKQYNISHNSTSRSTYE